MCIMDNKDKVLTITSKRQLLIPEECLASDKSIPRGELTKLIFKELTDDDCFEKMLLTSFLDYQKVHQNWS